MKKYVYTFAEGNKDMRELLGGKGANLAEMTGIGLPVPKGFIVTTEACLNYYDNNQQINDDIKDEIIRNIKDLEDKTGKRFGDKNNPLLVSVRSGARVSMPGMMDSILNIGLNDDIALNYSLTINNPKFVYDSYRRLIQMFADVVKGLPKNSFEGLFDEIKKQKGIEKDTDLSENDLKEVVAAYKQEYLKYMGVEFPQDPYDLLIDTISAVFRSWNNERAITYRKLNDIPSNWPLHVILLMVKINYLVNI